MMAWAKWLVVNERSKKETVPWPARLEWFPCSCCCCCCCCCIQCTASITYMWGWDCRMAGRVQSLDSQLLSAVIAWHPMATSPVVVCLTAHVMCFTSHTSWPRDLPIISDCKVLCEVECRHRHCGLQWASTTEPSHACDSVCVHLYTYSHYWPCRADRSWLSCFRCARHTIFCVDYDYPPCCMQNILFDGIVGSTSATMEVEPAGCRHRTVLDWTQILTYNWLSLVFIQRLEIWWWN